MVDGWMGDDWFHYGAFRQPNFDYIPSQTTKRGEGEADRARRLTTTTRTFRRAGSAGDYARAARARSTAVGAEDDRASRLRRVLAGTGARQADGGAAARRCRRCGFRDCGTRRTCGARSTATWRSKPKDRHDHNFLVMGPWRHSQVNYDGYIAGSAEMGWRHRAAIPPRRAEAVFRSVSEGRRAARRDTPPVFIYNTGENHWDRLENWPLACEKGAPRRSKPLYLTSGFRPGVRQARGRRTARGDDDYVSDPAKPVPYLPRPVRFADSDRWKRVAGDRPALGRRSY